jgi:DNA-directed RNA polymerase sigma subunit (sigma70/sigma32)
MAMSSNEIPYTSEERFDALLRRAVREGNLNAFVAKIELLLVAAITPEEENILRKRFGLGAEKPRSLEELAHELGLSPSAIREIEARALSKLKHPSRSDHLRSFMDQE